MLYPVKLGSVAAKISAAEDDHIARQLKSGQFYEADLLAALEPHLGNGDVVVDVGAHVGNHSAFFAAHARLIAVEPCPETAARWIATMQASRRTALLCTSPAGAEPGVRFGIRRFDDNTGRTQAAPDAAGNVWSTTIDELVGEQLVSVIKVDVEGTEAAVLAGARGALQRHRVVVAVEAHNSHRIAAIEAVLGPLGYTRGRRFCVSPTYLYTRS